MYAPWHPQGSLCNGHEFVLLVWRAGGRSGFQVGGAIWQKQGPGGVIHCCAGQLRANRTSSRAGTDRKGFGGREGRVRQQCMPCAQPGFRLWVPHSMRWVAVLASSWGWRGLQQSRRVKSEGARGWLARRPPRRAARAESANGGPHGCPIGCCRILSKCV